MKLFDHRCPITANCPITMSNYTDSADKLEENAAVYASITFEEIVINVTVP